jgi:hypothetical protein
LLYLLLIDDKYIINIRAGLITINIYIFIIISIYHSLSSIRLNICLLKNIYYLISISTPWFNQAHIYMNLPCYNLRLFSLCRAVCRNIYKFTIYIYDYLLNTFSRGLVHIIYTILSSTPWFTAHKVNLIIYLLWYSTILYYLDRGRMEPSSGPGSEYILY